jgi:peroxiredoxin Q/BCP
MGVIVIGISKDSVASHSKFAQKYELPFVLLSDPELQAIQAYGVWQEKKLYGKTSMGVVRSTYLINEEGIIDRVFPKVKPDTNAAEILAYLNHEV